MTGDVLQKLAWNGEDCGRICPFFVALLLWGKEMAKKLDLNKKTIRVLSVDELAAVAGGTLDSGSDTSLRTIDGPDTFHTMNATAPTLTAPPVEGDGTP